MTQHLEFSGVSLPVPAGYDKREQAGQVILVGEYSESLFDQIEQSFADAGVLVFVEYWGGAARIRAPSGLPGAKNIIVEARLQWQNRNPTSRKDVITFDSTSAFLVQGSTQLPGDLCRFVSDGAISTRTAYFSKVSRIDPAHRLAFGFCPDTVVEIRSFGNPRGELESKAVVLLSVGVKEVFIVDGINGLSKTYRMLGAGESEAEVMKEGGLYKTVSIQTLGKALRNEGIDLAQEFEDLKFVTVVDKKPTLLKSTVWSNFHLPLTPLKRDPFFWLPSILFFETDANGLLHSFPFQRRKAGVAYELPTEWQNVPEPNYGWESIEWADKRHDSKLMTDRASAAVDNDDIDALELALVHLSDINMRDSIGRLIMVEAIKQKHVRIARRLLDEGVEWLAEDSEGTCAHDAVCVWARDDAVLTSAIKDTPEKIVHSLDSAVRLESLDWFKDIIWKGAEHNLVLAAAVKAPTSAFLAAALQVGVTPGCATKFLLTWAGPVPRNKETKKKMEGYLEAILTVQNETGEESTELEADLMEWAIHAASFRIAGMLLDRGVDPNERFHPESAIEYLVWDRLDPEDGKRLVKILLERGAAYDEDEVRCVAKRKRREDWLDIESR